MTECLLSSGPWGWCFPWKYIVKWSAFDGVVMKSFSLTPKGGNDGYLRVIKPFGDGWINRVGLKNGGILEAENIVSRLSKLKQEKVIPSIAVHSDESDYDTIIAIQSMCSYKKFKAIEINHYCPSNYGRPITQSFLNDCVKSSNGVPLIYKLGPLTSIYRMTEMALNAGFSAIHAFNSYPVEINGLKWGQSGSDLTKSPGYFEKIESLRKLFTRAYIIGGGGIYNIEIAKRYINAGVDAVSIGSLCLMHPLMANKIAKEVSCL